LSRAAISQTSRASCDDGRPVFVDQETLFVGGETMKKLAVGHVVAVRFDSACEHVFATPPVTVLATGQV